MPSLKHVGTCEAQRHAATSGRMRAGHAAVVAEMTFATDAPRLGLLNTSYVMNQVEDKNLCCTVVTKML